MAPTATASSVETGYSPSCNNDSHHPAKQHAACSNSKSSRHSHRGEYHDRFYGHREMAELCEKVILALFACPLDSTSASVNAPSPSGQPAPRLSEFIAYALYRTRLPVAVTHQALYLLKRLKSRFPAARGSSGHRLFISALMLASKSSCDDTYSNKSWTVVGQGLFSLREINQMERELFGYLGYKVNVEPKELEKFVKGLEQGRIHTAPETVNPPTPSSSPSLACADDAYVATPASAPPHASMATVSVSALDVCNSASLPSESMAGPHRGVIAHRHSRQISSSTSSFNSRASVCPYSISQLTGPSSSSAAAYANVSVSAPSSVTMAKPTSFKLPAHANYPYANSARERCRPYSMHSMPSLSASSQNAPMQDRYYSNSPTPSISSASVCSSASSYAASSATSATPSPCASRSTISGRTTPDTPLSDVETSPWADAGYFACDSKSSTSPSCGGAESKHFMPPSDYTLHQQQQLAAMQPHSTLDSLHPYSCWRA